MVAKTFTLAGGGSWETGASWTPSGVPGAADTGLISTAVPGTYSVTIASATEQPAGITISDPTATLVVAANGTVLGSAINVTSGTLALNGLALSNTVTMAAAGVFTPSAGTLDGAIWDGALIGGGSAAAWSINIKDGISLFNLAGTGPGTIDIGSLYMVNVLDAIPLNNMTISFDNVNNEYLGGSNSFALNLGTNLLATQTLAASSGQINGLMLNNAGTINAASNGGNFYLQSTTFANSGSLLVSNSDHASINSNFRNTGTVSIASSGVLTILNNGTSSNTASISVASAGTLVANGDLLGAGTIALSTFAVADVHNVVGTLLFQDGRDTLKLEAPASYTGSIAGFQKGDKIDLPGQVITSLTPSFTAGGGTLTVMNGTTLVATLALSGNYTGATFGFAPDGQTGNQITVACYAEGTRILTARGEIAVEALRAGDLAVTLAGILGDGGALRPIVWIGQSRIDLARHVDAAAVAPVRIRAGAMAPGVPHRDLLVSPDHAILDGDVLMPAHSLVNGATILREAAVGTVRYYHVELDCHAVLLAEGLAAESYLDTGNRGAFDNAGGPRRLHPVFAAGLHAAAWTTRACRPLRQEGAAVDAAHARLLGRAIAMGYRQSGDAGLAVDADGVALAVEMTAPGRWTVRVPAGAVSLRLRSRAMVLSDRGLRDGRRAGIPVTGLRLNGTALALDDAALGVGFHPSETAAGVAWRWTDGDARLALPEGCGPAVLEVDGFTGWRSYWEDAPAAAAASMMRG